MLESFNARATSEIHTIFFLWKKYEQKIRNHLRRLHAYVGAYACYKNERMISQYFDLKTLKSLERNLVLKSMFFRLVKLKYLSKAKVFLCKGG